jgi:YVTN family beta-propeller protein
MNLLSTILDRLNQRIEAGNIFDQIYGLSELVGEGNDRAWAHYIGNGQAIPVTNFDAKQGTLFWAKRGKITVAKNESLRLAGCKSIYETRFSMTAYAMVRKSHLPCDSADAQDWIASRVLRLISGTDPQFKTAIGVVAYEVVPSGYVNEIRYLPVNYEWAAVAIDVDVNVSTTSEDGCYDTCATGDIPLPDFEPCVPCLTEVAVDGVTITGNGTEADPLTAIGGGGGTPLTVKEEGTNVSTNTTTLNFTGAGVTASLTSPGVVEVNVPGGGGGGGELLALPFTTDHISATGNGYVIGDVVWYSGNVYRCIANNDSLLPTNTSYWVSLGAGYPLVQQPSDWNATSGNNQILNKPTIPVLPASIVEDVTATAPIASTGGATPDISISQADGTTDGYLSSSDWNTFDGKQDALTAGTGIDLTGNVVTNTAPDQVVSLTAGTGISTSGTYPNFTIDNTAPDQIVSLTAGTDISISGTYPSFTIASTAGAGGMQGGQATGTDTYAVTIPGVTGYSLNDAYAIGFTNANTGASTLNINGLGAKNISKNNVVPIIGGDIAANQQFIVIYDGTNFQILGVAPNQMFAYVTNADSVTINRGQPVYAFGATGDRMTVKLANNTAEATSSKTIGLVFSTSIGPNQKGYIITQGVVDGINTNAYSAGDTLYVGNTAGSLTNVLPLAPNHLTRIGIVERANAGNGQIYVFVQNGFQLDELSDVDITTTPLANNQFLVYTTGTNNLWKNRTLGNVLGGTTSQYVRGDGSLATLPSASSTPYIEGELFADNNPLDVLVLPSINRLYVTNTGTGTLVIYDTLTNKRVSSVSIPAAAGVFYINSINEIWCTNTTNGNIARINPITGASLGANITGSGQRGQSYVEYSSTKVFIANVLSNTVTVVNPTTLTVTATITGVGTSTFSLAYNNNPLSSQFDRIAFIALGSSNIGLIDPNTNAVTISPLNPSSSLSSCTDVKYSAALDRYIVSNTGGGNNNRLVYITPQTVTTFAFDDFTPNFRPYEMALDNANNKLYSINATAASGISAFATLSVINLTTKLVEKIIITNTIDGSSGGFAFLDIDLINRYIYAVAYGGAVGIQRISKIKI